MGLKIAISTIDLKGSFKEKWKFHDSIEMVIFSFFGEGLQTHLVMLDNTHLRFWRVNDMRLTVSQALGIGAENIILHSTHNHTAPADVEIDSNQLCWLMVAGIQANCKKQVCAKMAIVNIDTFGSLNINRKKLLPHGLGKFTIWTGGEEKEGGYDGSAIALRRIKDWLGEDFSIDEIKKPLYYDDERDDLLQAVIFKNAENKVIGSLVRFCGHPAVAAHTMNRRYSGDVPGYVRRLMKEKFGGEHGFLTGPCGNIIFRERGEWLPLKPSNDVACMLPTAKLKGEDDCYLECSRIASEIVGFIEKEWPKDSEYQELKFLENHVFDFNLELRKDLLSDFEKAKLEYSKVIDDLKLNRSNYSLSKIKQLTDLANFYNFHKFFFELEYISHEEYRQGYITINIPSFKVNDLIFQGMPGESFWESAVPSQNWAKENNLSLISFSFANGSILYLPTEVERTFGDYEATLCICCEGAVDKLTSAIIKCSQSYNT